MGGGGQYGKEGYRLIESIYYNICKIRIRIKKERLK